MEHIIDDLMTQFYKVSFDKVNLNSKRLTKITETQINMLSMPLAYLQAKMTGFKFQKYQDTPVDMAPKQLLKV